VSIPNRIRGWIRTNIVGDESNSAFGRPKDFATDGSAPPSSFEDRVEGFSDELELVPPNPMSPEGDIDREKTKKFVEFWVRKLFDFVGSGILAGLSWLVFHFTGHRLYDAEAQEHAEKVEQIALVVVWVGCFVLLTTTKAVRARRKTVEPGGRANLFGPQRVSGVQPGESRQSPQEKAQVPEAAAHERSREGHSDEH
jgi:hypothetical protein